MLREPVFARNHPPSRLGSIGGPDEVQLQRPPSIRHHGQGGDYGMYVVVLEDTGQSSHVFVVCWDESNPEFRFLCSVHLFTVSCGFIEVLNQIRQTVRLRTITSCFPRDTKASTMLRPTAPVPPATAMTTIFANVEYLDRHVCVCGRRDVKAAELKATQSSTWSVRPYILETSPAEGPPHRTILTLKC
jgi:hypothetical protein